MEVIAIERNGGSFLLDDKPNPGKHKKLPYFLLGNWIAGFGGRVNQNYQQLAFQVFV